MYRTRNAVLLVVTLLVLAAIALAAPRSDNPAGTAQSARSAEPESAGRIL
jgi:hypothetical protein